MWIYLKDAFSSAVVDRDDPKRLLVRGRFPGDIERVLSKAEVIETPRADYRFRASVPRATVAEMLAWQRADDDRRQLQGLDRRGLAAWPVSRCLVDDASGAKHHQPDGRTTRNDQPLLKHRHRTSP